MSILYGPVASWRLGRSLGVDLISRRAKVCSFDCVYCQLGPTRIPLAWRERFVSLPSLEEELSRIGPVEADVVTFSGTGEPTLAANLGEAIDLVRRRLGLPVAVLTNSSLVTLPDVRNDLSRADVVVAKVDAPDNPLFERINRPLLSWRLDAILDGLRTFRSSYRGRLVLQMMFASANQSRAADLATIARSLEPDEVQLNTPLRPSAVAPLDRQAMAAIEREFAGLTVRNVYAAKRPEVSPVDLAETLRRRPVL